MIEFNHVTRSYSGKVAVDDLSLSVPPGEIFALLGANGARKDHHHKAAHRVAPARFRHDPGMRPRPGRRSATGA